MLVPVVCRIGGSGRLFLMGRFAGGVLVAAFTVRVVFPASAEQQPGEGKSEKQQFFHVDKYLV